MHLKSVELKGYAKTGESGNTSLRYVYKLVGATEHNGIVVLVKSNQKLPEITPGTLVEMRSNQRQDTLEKMGVKKSDNK